MSDLPVPLACWVKSMSATSFVNYAPSKRVRHPLIWWALPLILSWKLLPISTRLTLTSNWSFPWNQGWTQGCRQRQSRVIGTWNNYRSENYVLTMALMFTKALPVGRIAKANNCAVLALSMYLRVDPIPTANPWENSETYRLSCITFAYGNVTIETFPPIKAAQWTRWLHLKQKLSENWNVNWLHISVIFI